MLRITPAIHYATLGVWTVGIKANSRLSIQPSLALNIHLYYKQSYIYKYITVNYCLITIIYLCFFAAYYKELAVST
jgi:hypothetical protein